MDRTHMIDPRRWFVTYPEDKHESLLRALALSIEMPDAFTRAFAGEMIKAAEGSLIVPDKRGICERRGFTTDHMGLAVVSAGFYYLLRADKADGGWRFWADKGRRLIEHALKPGENVVDALASLDDKLASLDL